MFDNQNDLIV